MTFLWPSKFIPMYVPNRNAYIIYVYQKTCVRMFTTALCIRAPNWKEHKCPSTEQQWEWTNHKYSDNINFADTMLNKESQTEKYVLYSSIYRSFLKRQNQSILFKVKILANFGGKKQSLGKEHERNSFVLFLDMISYLGHTTYNSYLLCENTSNHILTMFTFFCIYVVHH